LLSAVMTKNWLPDYAVLGRVVRGLAVVDRIGKFGDATGTPSRRVVVQHATVSTH